ncbi:MAG: hydantoinase/oxoprolinase family protein, partial [Actinobacteria bacterium]|nr:hydantoinase/oxoprolinase family protein [Actinomycetota bacterium]
AFAHGTTVATNALLERRGARTALVTTEGFRDLIEIGRQNRASLYDLTAHRPPPLVPRDLRYVVKERCGPHGVITPLDEDSLLECVQEVSAGRPEAVAVCLLFGYLHPEHESRVADGLRAALPATKVACSHEVLPEFREYERFSTTVADAYLGPPLSGYLNELAEQSKAARLSDPLVMQSSGGVVPIDAAAGNAAACVLSGPAGGAVGAARVATESGYRDVLSFDMGGTSSDVAAIVDGQARTTTEGVVGGIPIKLPMVDVHTIGAGGGSILWSDGEALRAGPHSAGAEPGPACYGLGGAEPTVTDCNLLLGYLQDGAIFGGEIALDAARSEEALEALGSDLNLSAEQTAVGGILVAEAEMARALRVISVERGLDPRGFALLAFGGAGPLHACALAEELGMTVVLVPRACGVLSALGLALGDLRRDVVAPFLHASDSVDVAAMETVFDELKGRIGDYLRASRLQRGADLRYAGQSYELTVECDDVAVTVERFHAAHESRYGYGMPERAVEFVNLRLTAIEPVEVALPVEPPSEGSGGFTRRIYVSGDWKQVEVIGLRNLDPGTVWSGPSLIELGESTCLVRSGWSAKLDDIGTLVLTRESS